MISESHPLQKLFLEMVGRHYAREIGLRDPQVVGYVAHLLAEFCDVDHLFNIRNVVGRPLSDVGEMLLEADPVYGPAPSFDRERQVRKHIGDYTLFFTGMFPESINHLRLRRQPQTRRKGLDDKETSQRQHRVDPATAPRSRSTTNF